MALERRRANRLAGFGAAQMHHVPAAALGAEIMIEADHAMHFGARQVQLLRDELDRILRNEPQGLLNRMQNRQQGARQLFSLAQAR